MNTFLYSPNLFKGAIVGLDPFNPLAGIIVSDAGTKQEKIAAMRDLFDRSKGRIKQLIIEKKSGEKVRPSQKGAWASEWRRWNVKSLFSEGAIYGSDLLAES